MMIIIIIIIIKQCEGSKNQSPSDLVALMAVQSDFEALQQLAAAVKRLKDDAKVAAERHMTWHRLTLSVMAVSLDFNQFHVFFCAQSFQVEEPVIQKLNPCKACS